MGGREAEQLLLEDLSIGSAGDLERATEIARALVEEFGMGGDAVGLGRNVTVASRRETSRQYSPAQLEAIDRQVRQLLEEARARAAAILGEQRALVETLRDMLLEHQVIDAKTLKKLV